MNKHSQNREIVISRVKKELIGPGSDIFECIDKVNFLDEIIEGKPLQRYFSAILFPKQHSTNGADNPQEQEDDDAEDIINELSNIETFDELTEEKTDSDSIKIEVEDDKENQYSASTFFPSQYGISFSVSDNCPEIKVIVSFGNYKKAKVNDVAIQYNGDSINLLTEFGLDKYVSYDKETKLLRLNKELSKEEKKQRSIFQYEMAKDHHNSGLYKTLLSYFLKINTDDLTIKLK